MWIAIALAVALGLQAASIVAGDASTVDSIPVTLSEKLVRYEVKGDTSHELFDHMKKVKRPFQILSGGYQIIFKGGKWTQVFGSETKKKRFAKEDRRGHRSELRKKRHKLKPATVKDIRRVKR